MVKIKSKVGMKESLQCGLINFLGYATKPFNYRGLYTFSKHIGRLCAEETRIQILLEEDSVYEFALNDPYWARLIHQKIVHEPEIHHFLRLLSGKRFVFVDGGANWGYWSILASSKVYGAEQTIAYEPMPKALEYLRANQALNGERFSVIPKAIAKEDAFGIPMHVMAGAELSAVESSIAQGAHGGGTTLEVDAFSLDHVLRTIITDAPVVLKLDLEGVEAEVIQGSKDIENREVALIFEDHAKDLQCKATKAVLERGWLVYFFHDDGKIEEIKALEQAAKLKTNRHRGYNFFAWRRESVFAHLCDPRHKVPLSQ